MRILILGSGSFAGQVLFSKLIAKGLNVYGINRSPLKTAYEWEWVKNCSNKINWYELNLHNQPEEFRELIKKIKPTHVIDFLGQGMVAPSWEDPRLWYRVNLSEKSFILEEIRKLDSLEKYVRAGTPEVYGSNESMIKETSCFNPSTPYAVSHSAIDYHIRCLGKQFEFPFSIGRFANFYGEGQQLYRIIPKVIICCLSKNKFTLDGKGLSTRSFIYSDDIFSAMELLLFKAECFTEYNFSGTEHISILELVKYICEKCSTDFNQIISFGPERMGKDKNYKLNCSKAKKELNWSPRFTLSEGIDNVINWMSRNYTNLLKLDLSYKHKI